jgi:hypothetical protein
MPALLYLSDLFGQQWRMMGNVAAANSLCVMIRVATCTAQILTCILHRTCCYFCLNAKVVIELHVAHLYMLCKYVCCHRWHDIVLLTLPFNPLFGLAGGFDTLPKTMPSSQLAHS